MNDPRVSHEHYKLITLTLHSGLYLHAEFLLLVFLANDTHCNFLAK